MTFVTPRKSFSSFSISIFVMLGFLLGFSKHSSVVMHVPVEIGPFVSKTTVADIQKLSVVYKYMTQPRPSPST